VRGGANLTTASGGFQRPEVCSCRVGGPRTPTRGWTDSARSIGLGELGIGPISVIPQHAYTAPVSDTSPLAAVRPQVSVLYIGGCQRSGSTLLDRMMSQVPGYVSTGEVVHLWSRGVDANELCGCGLPFLECPFWSEVGRRAFGGWSEVDVKEILALQRRVDRNRFIPYMLFPVLSTRFRRDLQEYSARLERLYRAISEVSDGAVIVDSSKHASTAFLLRQVRSVRLRVIHLVRDSRGVAFSLAKQVRRPEAMADESFMFRASSLRSAAEWVAFNLLLGLLRFVGTPTTVVRYEDMVRAPRSVISRALAAGGAHASAEDLAFVQGAHVTLGIDHTVAGNPMRFRHEPLELRVDEAWRSSMDRRARHVTTALTWPLLATYGYARGDRR
jgi:hypothetical protein